jgi:hypothetical protein
MTRQDTLTVVFYTIQVSKDGKVLWEGKASEGGLDALLDSAKWELKAGREVRVVQGIPVREGE